MKRMMMIELDDMTVEALGHLPMSMEQLREISQNVVDEQMKVFASSSPEQQEIARMGATMREEVWLATVAAVRKAKGL